MSERLLVRDLMTIGVKTCPTDTPIRGIVHMLLEGVMVLDEEGHGVGVVTQDELVQAYARHDVPQIPPDIPLKAAAQLMQDMGVRVFFLMHHRDGIHYPAAAREDSELSDLGYASERLIPAARRQTF